MRCCENSTEFVVVKANDFRGYKRLAYFLMGGDSYLLSEFLVDSILLNDCLSLLTRERQKRRALKKLVLWLGSFHDHEILQREFKSSDVLCRDGHYFLGDLDSVKISHHLPYEKGILNLAQLNASLGNAITIKDRLVFTPAKRQRNCQCGDNGVPFNGRLGRSPRPRIRRFLAWTLRNEALDSAYTLVHEEKENS